jgi:hypothetical protein
MHHSIFCNLNARDTPGISRLTNGRNDVGVHYIAWLVGMGSSSKFRLSLLIAQLDAEPRDYFMFS